MTNSVITSRSSRRAPARNAETETSEYDGLWINVGVSMGNGEEDADATFVRLPRGIAVSDLQPRKIYNTMDPDYAAQSNLMNQLISTIQAKALTLDEGESCPINLEVVLYRRQEEADVAPAAQSNADLEKALFGG